MASYDRRFLVPYLQNVCFTEMLCAKLSRDVATCQANVNRISSYVNQKLKPLPTIPKRNNNSEILFIFIPIAVLIFSFLTWGSILGSLAFFASIFLFACFFSTIKDIIADNQREYNEAVQEYAKAVRFNDDLQKNYSSQKNLLQNEQQNLTKLKSRLATAQNLRSRVYGVNIIPSRYRDIYAAYYLYDYFKSGRENDLDKVIQTMLLDEIRRQLQKIVVQNEQIMINQRMQIALQERTNQMISDNHKREMQQLIKMEHNQELQQDYQKMMIENQMVTNFFLAEEHYIRERERLNRR